MIDSHRHLSDDQIQSGRAVVNATSEKDWDAVLDVAKDNPHIIPAIGIHPWYADQVSTDWESKLRHHLAHNPVLTIGEIGLDRSRACSTPFKVQLGLFQAQLNLAREFQRPASIHCVKAWGALTEFLSPNPGTPIILHSVACSLDTLRQVTRLPQVYASVSPRTLQSRNAKALITSIPEDRLLIETDFPDAPRLFNAKSTWEDELEAVTSSVREIRNSPIPENFPDTESLEKGSSN